MDSLVKIKEIIPGSVAYLRFKDRSIIPFLKEERESRYISNWTARIVEGYTGLIILALMIAWITLSLVIIWT